MVLGLFVLSALVFTLMEGSPGDARTILGQFATVVLLVAGLGFLGLGVQLPTPD
jgi:hypothetical protein